MGFNKFKPKIKIIERKKKRLTSGMAKRYRFRIASTSRASSAKSI